MNLFSNNDVDIKEMLCNMFRVGEVDSIDAEKCTVRVTFPDDEEVVSHDLQVLHINTKKNKDYNMPDVGEDVLCLFLPTGMAEGFVLGSVYAWDGDVKPPESSEDKRTVEFSDKARFSYDRKESQFDIKIDETTIKVNKQNIEIKTPQDVKINAENNVEVTAKNNVKIEAENDVEITAKNNVTISAESDVEITAESNVKITAETEVTVECDDITLDGDVTVTGTLTTEGGLTSSM